MLALDVTIRRSLVTTTRSEPMQRVLSKTSLLFLSTVVTEAASRKPRSKSHHALRKSHYASWPGTRPPDRCQTAGVTSFVPPAAGAQPCGLDAKAPTLK